MKKPILLAVGVACLSLVGNEAFASCKDINRNSLAEHAAMTVKANNWGYGLPMWVTVVDETGKVCQVVNTAGSGEMIGNSGWLGSRIISAQKANTANAFSIDGYAISTANLYTPTQPGNSLYGLQHSNPVDASVAYLGSPKAYGTAKDPLVNKRIGGINVFGGGLALYSTDGKKKIGAIGVSGDTSCTDHVVAWKIRAMLQAEPAGSGITTANMMADGTKVAVSTAQKGDELIQLSGAVANDRGKGWNGWAHPLCPNNPPASNANGIVTVNSAQ
ncbi:MAG: heme-binding protein [Methylococcaceae bacterium]|nr:heme-binding protein [Methylococcaceae bacterium]